ncbi:MAG: hypothetical protein JRN06_01580 [Nitrososphaerota archaeon]|nr:hypothetical protein [Nitrososphaerota archaeon]MDG7023456.1 hypothetical protein [Nitrososphaerota archaeon]
MRPKAIHVVYAKWCPHCVPTTVEPLNQRAKALGVPCLLHDIDSDDVEAADDLVRNHGDWTDDYLIPQVFLEYDGGRVEHVLTGNPRGVALTKGAVEALLKSEPLAIKDGAGAGSK